MEEEQKIMAARGFPSKPEFEDFNVAEEIGHGNYSRVVRATHISSGVTYAIKEISKSHIARLSKRHPNVKNEILIEKRSLFKLDHPNIVKLHTTFQTPSHLFFVQEYLDGAELWDLMKEGETLVGLPESVAGVVFSYLARAVHYCHSQGIVHRDLKPENVMITTEGRLVIVDWGTSKDLRETDLNGMEFVGTPDYMSPEVINNKGATEESDVWALGCILYQMLSGRTPFSTPSNYLTMEKAKGGKFPIPPTLSQPALDLIKQMLAVAKEDRIAMKDLLQHPWVQRFSAQSEGPATPVLEQLVKEWRSAKKTQQRSEEKKEEGEGLEAVQVNVEAVRRAGDESSSEAVADLARSIASAKTVSVSALRELLLPLPAALQKQLQYQLWLRRVPLQVFWAFQSDDAAGRLSLIHHFLCDFEGESVLGHNQLSQGEFKDVDIACVPLLEGDKDAVIEHWRSAAQYLASRKRQPKVVFALSPGNWSEDVVKRSEVLDSTTLVIPVSCKATGASRLAFWCQGVRVLVLPPNPSSSDFEWFHDALEDSKFAAQHSMVVCPWKVDIEAEASVPLMHSIIGSNVRHIVCIGDRDPDVKSVQITPLADGTQLKLAKPGTELPKGDADVDEDVRLTLVRILGHCQRTVVWEYEELSVQCLLEN